MSKSHPEGWEIGMTVWAVMDGYRKNSHSEPFVVRITKIGRTWIYYSYAGKESRFDAVTRMIDGGDYCSPGKVYHSFSEFQEECEIHQLWNQFRQRLGYKPPAKITPERIRALIEELT